ncbi:pantoate--beta-alanine ligase [Arenivirga flava]|uniref:Pantothenate synthetase n=1 Tax=Arenivirga flava TaxID=1930060 RepID=A0AA37ULD9_9MICO|nr:pantoate--beta-alanine ligase [Arenivirga flava]GMA28632.1 pantothenate synthetase [Arenivirga flava]
MTVLIDSIAGLREQLAQAAAEAAMNGDAGTIALVPTMGALHAGHVALVERAQELADIVVVSLFVNPLQFGRGEDLDRYPRTLDDDLRVLRDAGVPFLFAPSAAGMYPRGGSETSVTASGVAGTLEGASRPGHFDGVLTVVAKLLNIVQPDTVLFGQKDAQQAFLVGRMIENLDLPVRQEIVETVRDRDGLALSSRNRFLGAEERQAALAIPAMLAAAETSAGEGVAAVRAAAEAVAAGEPLLELDYFTVVDPDTFAPVAEDHAGEAQVLIAARVGTTRLIDNGRLRIG